MIPDFNGLAETFDYVIIGAGAAGCVLAIHLSQAPDISGRLVSKHALNDRG